MVTDRKCAMAEWRGIATFRPSTTPTLVGVVDGVKVRSHILQQNPCYSIKQKH